MKTGRILTLIAIPLLIAAMFSCNNGVAPLTEEERTEILSETMTAFNELPIGEESTKESAAAPSRALLATGEGYEINGMYTATDINVTITFTNYESASVIISGTITISGSSTSSENVATLTVTYKGGAHSLNWNFSYSNGMLSGSYTIDGSSYSY